MNACSMPLSQAAAYLGAELPEQDLVFKGVSTDTRSVSQGELFIALQGDHFDAHEFLEQAVASGAVAAVVSRPVPAGVPVLMVEDTRLALGLLAGAWRAQFDTPVVGVTGSNGKTTVKEMVATILKQDGRPLVTQGNLNNDIGVPLTLFNLDSSHTHAVIEMGANHIGEIEYLAGIAKPEVGVVTNAMSAHLEGFGSLDGVALAKGEMFAALEETGTAIINCDDTYADDWRDRAQPARVLGFGLSEAADISAEHIRFDVKAWQTCFTLRTPSGEIEINLPMAGQHNVMNALAAAAATFALGMSLEIIQQGLAEMSCVKGRLFAQRTHHGAQLIDDTYNANPDSLQAGLDVLAQLPGKRILVIGDMAELGDDSEALHSDIAAQAREAGVQFLYALGKQSAAAVERFGNGAHHFMEHDALSHALSEELDENSVILVKGSRSARMERVVNALLEDDE